MSLVQLALAVLLQLAPHGLLVEALGTHDDTQELPDGRVSGKEAEARSSWVGR